MDNELEETKSLRGASLVLLREVEEVNSQCVLYEKDDLASDGMVHRRLDGRQRVNDVDRPGNP
jgi:hypothetical protein